MKDSKWTVRSISRKGPLRKDLCRALGRLVFYKRLIQEHHQTSHRIGDSDISVDCLRFGILGAAAERFGDLDRTDRSDVG